MNIKEYKKIFELIETKNKQKIYYRRKKTWKIIKVLKK